MLRRLLLSGLSGLLAVQAQAYPGRQAEPPPGTPLTVQVKPLAPAPPSVTLPLGVRTGRVTPSRHGFAKTAGGNIDVQQPAADTVVVTMTGVALAGAHPCEDSQASLDF